MMSSVVVSMLFSSAKSQKREPSLSKQSLIP
jgi:hypothetical protein